MHETDFFFTIVTKWWKINVVSIIISKIPESIRKCLTAFISLHYEQRTFGIELYLRPTYFVDSEQPDIQRFVKTRLATKLIKLKLRLSYITPFAMAVRYNPYNIDLRHTAMKASSLFNREKQERILHWKSLFCWMRACVPQIFRVVLFFWCKESYWRR